jgi:hypothetical protein
MNTMRNFNADVWGPHYWFFLHTVAYSYPDTPNTITKRKYYDLIQNMPLFIPTPGIGNEFSKLLDKYPVSPYLDSRDSFIRWVHFIHNKINIILGKEEISLFEANDRYNAKYKPKPVLLSERLHIKKYHIYITLTLIFLFLIYIYSDR